MISEDTINAVRERANLIEIAGELVNVKRAGRNHVALCPFHAEKSPSFHLREDGKGYHCFGCGVSGNVFSFVMQLKGLSFPEAVEELALKLQIPIKYENTRAVRKKDDSAILYQINQTALRAFKEALKTGRQLKEYLQQRNLSAEAIERFSIGFAPAGWNYLVDILRPQKFPEEIMLKSGLVRRNERGGLYDGYRGRLIFPIFVDNRHVAGFGGRVIPSLFAAEELDRLPKYINSPENDVYHKSRQLFGYPQAFQTIRQSGEVYLVEGYMDVVSMHMAGVTNTLAACGTAVTEEHVRKLSRLCSRVFILLDGDRVGRDAAAKSFLAFLNSGLETFAVFLPDGEDPDSFVLKHGKAGLDELRRSSLFECYLNGLIERNSEKTRSIGAAEKGRISQELLGVIKLVRNPVEQSSLIEKAAARLMLSPDQLGSALVNAKPLERAIEITPDEQSVERVAISGLERAEQDLLLACMAKRELIGQVLRDPKICAQLKGVVLQFLNELWRINQSERLDDQKRRDMVELLKHFGPSWIRHWKEAHRMANDVRADLEQLFKECLRSFKKTQLLQQVSYLDGQIVLVTDENQKLELIHRQIGLRRQLEENQKT